MQRIPDAMSWDDVRLFLALYRSRTVGVAAASLGVDASTVSRRLVVLEEQLKTSLFDRGRAGVAATKSAEDLVPVAEEIEAAMQRFATAAENLEREVSGLVRITCPPDVAQVIVTPVLGQLRRDHPALSFQLDPGEALLDLTRREADLALRVVRPRTGDLIVTKLTTITWIVAASPALAKQLATLRTWTDAPWISFGERTAHVGPARWHAKHVGTEPVVRSDSLAVQLASATAGLGVALVPAPSLPHYGLVPVKLAPGLRADAKAWPDDDLFLVTHRALRDVPRVRAVWDALVEHVTALRR